MKIYITLALIAFAFATSTQAATFNSNPLEVHEVNCLEDGLYLSDL